ncbi:MAG TPA: cyclic nucleotide-binding domain-containing protein [Kofleriaceae bacterium]
MTIAFHTANALYLISYAVRDILWLRLITVLGGGMLLLSFFLSPQPPTAAIAWNVIFLVINTVRIHLLIRERRPVPLAADEQHLANLVFRTLRPRELARLVRTGRLVDHAAGERIVSRGIAISDLMVIVRGTASVKLADRAIPISDGTFIGELGFLTGKPPGADVEAVTPLRVLRWQIPALRAFLDDNPELRATMQQVLGADLAEKLRGGPKRSSD